jgi:hypothetical protein
MTDDNILEPELAALGAEVSAFAPKIDKGFKSELGAKVAEGFPRERPSWFGAWKLPASRKLIPGIGLAAALLVGVVAVGVGTRGGGGSADSFVFDSAKKSSVPVAISRSQRQKLEAARERKAGALSAADAAPGAAPRKVERSTQLTLRTSSRDVQAVADGVVRKTQAMGGYVADSSVSTSSHGGNAQFTLRIPSKNLDKTIAALSKLANVGSLSQDTSDITSSYVSAADRLRDSQAERKALLKALAGASGPGQIASLKQRIVISRQDIATAKSAVRKLQRRADLATVDVEISGKGARKDAGAGWTPKDAAGDAVTILGVIAGGVIVGLAIAVPALIVAGLAWLLLGALARRRREAALNSA